ncbi:MAG: cysteine desulfurase [Deltaproteobacteria bacterium]|nr:cysteine desulfurase [Deltaproteobacteria bacterium]
MADTPCIYLDYNATAPLWPEAAHTLSRAAAEAWANPSSTHRPGQQARAALEEARGALARWLSIERAQLTFTSGGSEGNNTLLGWLAWEPRPVHLVISAVEHPSVLRVAEWLESRGVEVSRLPVNPQGQVMADRLEELLRPHTRLVSVMTANSETGVIQPLGALGALLARLNQDRPPQQRVWFHTDAVQAAGRIPLDWKGWGVDAATLTAHKMGGPKGIGLLWAAREYPFHPLVRGGGQERGRRSGTEPAYLAAAFATAAEQTARHQTEFTQRWREWRDALARELAQEPGFFLVGELSERLPNTLNGGFEGVPSDLLAIRLDLAGVAVSTGSACQSGAAHASHVLEAMGLPEARREAAIRISLGHGTTWEHCQQAAEIIRREAAFLRG